jgi:RNA polymerase sigma factor (sigma-70 family)
MRVISIELEEKDEAKRSYKYEYAMNERYFLRQSNVMSLEQIINKTKEDKEYIFNFIKQPEIQHIINILKSSYKFNKDEVEDAAIFAITEYFYTNSINTKDFNKELFLSKFQKDIKNSVQNQMRNGYSAKEYPSSDWLLYENSETILFEDDVITKVDFINSINKLSYRDKTVLELYYLDNYTQQEIANITKLSQPQISNILNNSKNIF